jgi:flagellar FliL protein
MSTFSSEDISGREGKQKLADALKEGINNTLMKVEGFGGVENVHFTSFVLQ